VVKRMMSDVEFGLFLSGGIDSCIVGTLMRPHVPASKRLPSFCVGMADSPDITAAREIAKQLGYDHSEVRAFPALSLSSHTSPSLPQRWLPPRDGPIREFVRCPATPPRRNRCSTER
jgi:NH3-dependent NAD+ synthetase